MGLNLLPPWLWEQLETLSQQQPFGSGRVRLGFAFDLFFIPKEMVLNLYNLVRKSGIKLITNHYVKGPILGEQQNYSFFRDSITILTHR
jgi:hypothetical protein